jgi:dual-specificity kinase
VPDAELTEKCRPASTTTLAHIVRCIANLRLDQISRLLGQGTFGKVVQATDRKRNQAVAVKIIRSVQKYRDASRIELRVLATLKANDANNRYRCIHLTDCFDYRGHICIVMDLLGQSVFDFLKGNGFVPFPNSHIQNFARQLFTSVACKCNSCRQRVDAF